jgi:apolipoprotein D and lipocalin family protein
MTGNKHNSGKPETVESVDLRRYSGKWYEIAFYSKRFTRYCYGRTAVYTLSDKGYLLVKNSWHKEGLHGKPVSQSGKAFVVKDSGNAKFKMQFFWPFWSAYWIIELADDYSCAVVSHSGRNFFRVLSRTPIMNPEVYHQITTRLLANGFDPGRLQLTPQG